MIDNFLGSAVQVVSDADYYPLPTDRPSQANYRTKRQKCLYKTAKSAILKPVTVIEANNQGEILNMNKITLQAANAIIGKVGEEIRRASSSERRDALYSGVDNPRWVIDRECFKPEKAFGTVSEAFRYVCRKRFEELEGIELTDNQRELVRRAVYE